jgi:hypothetical protein
MCDPRKQWTPPQQRHAMLCYAMLCSLCGSALFKTEKKTMPIHVHVEIDKENYMNPPPPPISSLPYPTSPSSPFPTFTNQTIPYHIISPLPLGSHLTLNRSSLLCSTQHHPRSVLRCVAWKVLQCIIHTTKHNTVHKSARCRLRHRRDK